MTDHTQRDLIVDAHYRANVDRLMKRIGVRVGNPTDARDIVQSGYELALRYFGSLEKPSHFNTWFEVVLGNAKKKFMNDRRSAGLTSTMWDYWNSPPPEPLALAALAMIDDRPDNERRILTLRFVMGYSERADIPDMVPETEKQVRRIVAKFKKQMNELDKKE